MAPYPCPLSADLPLAALVAGVATQSVPLGVWLLGARRPTIVVLWQDSRQWTLMLDADLGRLLQACPAVVVQLGAAPAVIPANDLARVRALRISFGRLSFRTAAPLRGAGADPPGGARGAAVAEIALGQRSAEELLARYAKARVPVVCTQVVYGPISTEPRPLTPDRPRP